jgi:hypothetical protein
MTAVIVVTPRGKAGHFLIMMVTSPTMKPPIKREEIIRIGGVIAGILLIPIAAVSYQASSIPSSQLVNPNELVKILQSSAGERSLIVRPGILPAGPDGENAQTFRLSGKGGSSGLLGNLV